jgi:hypothetical protein
MSLRKISAELAAAGHLNEHGRPYHAQSIRDMVLSANRARARGAGGEQ